MRKIYVFLVATLDGYYEGPNGEFDWPNVDAEFDEFGLEQLNNADTLLFGRVTFEGMASYWPTPEAKVNDAVVADRMNEIAKVVVSRTLENTEWNNSSLVRDVADVAKLKEQPGRDIIIFGSSDLTVSLLREGLIDEIRVMTQPVILGAGKSLFRTSDERIGVKLTGTRVFDSGNVLLCYEPTAKP